MKRRILIPVIIALLLALAAVVLASETTRSLYKDIKLITSIINEVHGRYVDSIDTHEFILGGIKGMLGGLDPHTVYLEPKDYGDLKTNTRGEFGGLGIIIGMRDNILTVISPMEGTPAYRLGLKAGDKIVKIDGDPTKGMTTSDAVDVLRGEPGTEVTITVIRPGEPDPIDYTIVRDIIHIEAVPFAGMTEDSIGYIRLARFSDDAGREVRQAVDSLQSLGMKSLIFDLRSNPGGLLSQAVEVASVFLEPGDLVVYTKGKDESQYREYEVRWGSEYTEEPLIVLVNGGSASASEIVSGSIQDHDRGVIMGTKTFGKGLVQSVIQLSSDGDALKITTSKYYIASDRCIQKEDYLKRPESVIETPDLVQDEEIEEKDAEGNWWEDEQDAFEEEGEEVGVEEDAPVFYTDNGRVVYGGGGITPDIFVDPETASRLIIELERQSMFFDFAVEYTLDNGDIRPDFVVDEELISQFMDYLDEKDFSYTSRPEAELARVETLVTQLEYSEQVDEAIQNLYEAFRQEKENAYESEQEYIQRALKREIVTKLWGEDANYQYVVLETDKAILQALDLIRSGDDFSALLIPGDEDK